MPAGKSLFMPSGDLELERSVDRVCMLAGTAHSRGSHHPWGARCDEVNSYYGERSSSTLSDP